MMSDCLFCKIAAGEIPTELVHSDEHCVAFRDIHPKAPVHLLLIPRVHCENLRDATEQHPELLAHMMAVAPKIAEQAGARDFRLITNNGAGSGQEVFHLHFHLLGGGSLHGL